MQVIPAIDIRGGRVVRLRQGDYGTETVFDVDPVAAARRWLAAGAERLHVVDLDGARGGTPANFAAVTEIAALGTSTQVGGGIRSAETAARYLDAGLDRIVLGTAAVRDIALVKVLCRDHGEAIVLSIDARAGLVATDGWTKTSTIPAEELAGMLVDSGARRFVYTDIARDGTLTEPNYDALRRFVAAVDRPVIASGGVATVEQIPLLALTDVEGVIVGRALYDGRIDLMAAMMVAVQC